MLTNFGAVLLVLAFRSACLGRVRPPLSVRAQLVSGLWLGIAGWTVGALLQAWVPLWEMLLLGSALAATLAALRANISLSARAAADFIAVAALGPLSVIPVRTANVVAAAVVFTAAGLALDGVTRSLSPQTRWRLLAQPGILLVLLAISVRQVGDFDSRLLVQQPLFLLRLALVAPNPGARARLESGTAAWILRTPSNSPRGTAILLHGNDPRASWQPAALALQGALVRAGYDVLSVDHIGYGATPLPNARADWRAWDPAIGPRQALSYLHSANAARAPETIVVAHSMGVDVALEWLKEGADVQAAYLFGGSIDRPTGPENAWISVFHQQRRIPCCMPLQTMRMIRDQFYSGADRFTAALPRSHPVVHFVRFGIEYADVARDREPLYTDLSPPKTACNLAGVTHYFNTLSVRGFVLIDTLTVRRTAELFSVTQPAAGTCRGQGPPQPTQ